MNTQKSLYTFLWAIAKRYKGWIFLYLVPPITISAFNGALSSYIVKLFINTISENVASSTIWLLALCYFLVGISTEIGWRLSGLAYFKGILYLQGDIMTSMYNYIQAHSYRYFQNNLAGSISQSMNNMDDAFYAFTKVLRELWKPLTIIVSVIFLYYAHPVFAIITITWLIIFVSIVCIFSKKLSILSANFSTAYASYVGRLNDVITNIFSIKSFARDKQESAFIAAAVENNVQTSINAWQYDFLQSTIFSITLIFWFGTILFFLVKLKLSMQITIGDFALVLAIVQDIANQTWALPKDIADIYRALGKMKQSFIIMTIPHEIIDAQSAKSITITHGDIVFKQVSFSYDIKNIGSTVFNNFNFHIKHGEKIGLIGHSGIGKTTFINLIMRFYDVQGGTILIDGQDITQVSQESLRNQITLIPQDTNLFHRSIIENIKYGNIYATDQEVIKAAQLAHVHEFVEKLPQKYATIVGERGMKLSGGQRQRIAIARAFLKHSPILILDEATSSLDTETESLIQDALITIMKNRTVIAIAHRISTLDSMDRVIDLSKIQ